ncbi:MAG: hypothetical protein IK061_10275 [Desulfovibrio sp.]|nr:hypothetical protein [Desulfovibrio sp.]
MADVSALLREGYQLKQKIDADTARLRQVNAALAELCEYPDGKMTGHLSAGTIRAKVTKKVNLKWDQARLLKAYDAMGAEEFRKVFKYEFKPKGAKELAGFLDFGKPEHVALVQGALTETPGAPAVTYEVIEDA